MRAEGTQKIRLDGLLKIIVITHVNLGGLLYLTRYPKHMGKNVKKFDTKRSTDRPELLH